MATWESVPLLSTSHLMSLCLSLLLCKMGGNHRPHILLEEMDLMDPVWLLV